MRYGVKTDINDNVSIGVFYDEPWGAEVEYTGNSTFVSQAGKDTIADSSSGISVPNEVINPSVLDPDYDKNTNVRVHTETWTGLVGFKSNGFQVYGGPVLQKAEAEVHLRGQAYGPLTGYDANVNNDTAYGWAAGLAYSKPEIALKAALTYRSEIEHETPIGERVPLLGSPLKGVVLDKLGIDPNSDLGKSIGEYATTDATVTTPESVNLNIETGLSQKYQLLGTLDVRWVPWSDFSIVPPLYNAYSKAAVPEGLPLLSYDKDQWKVDVGLAKRFNEKLAGSVVVGYDSGAGDPISSLGTIDGYYSLGGGVKYNVTPEWAVSVGGKYLKFGDATGQLPNGSIVSKFQDNDGYIAGVKLSYQSQ
ncbi:outer membrane protein E [Psychrobacter sp. JCM 18903]|uniref:outer membrane protein transport protein n=2 Tax=Moraxellaceae TaxID=468 RepID=UPI00043240EF|nr:outer membrane protein transport protein [Psychrobacter sp. JCM 18903]GAF62530.1 outer membrane protein E [Psychrobacter sp. JCM 18903]